MVRQTAHPKESAKKVTKKLLSRTSEEFDAAYATLNKEQKAAVDAIDGPVMVVAGPGTGKTQVVGLRVANILRKTQMRPGNILCLTFSTSGATAMRDRLRSLIGPDAYGVTVSTIHGFCNDIINNHPHVFEDWAALNQISDVERYRSLNKIIDQLLPDLELVNKKMPYLRTRDILQRISQLKREGKTDAVELEKVAAVYDEQMAGKSKEGTKAHQKNLASARKFREFIEIFHRYQKMLADTHRYDYDDMILTVTRALKEEDWMLASLQERYQYVLVDEFQDTNGAQYSFIELLTTDPTGDNAPNLFVVGDDDQAIYRFQGANLANILSFRTRFPDAPVVALTTSYRCTQSILDAAHNVIEHNSERLVGHIDGLTKDLKAASGEKGSAPALLLSPSDMTEAWMIADLVEERLEKKIEPNDIAILVQTNRELEPIYDVLRARNIPVQMGGKVDLLTHPLVEQVIMILRAVINPNDPVLAAAIASDGFGCHPADIARLYNLRREKEISLYDALLLVDDPSADLDLHLSNKEAILNARDTLLSLHQHKDSRTILETLEHVMIDCGLLKSVSESDPLDFAALQEFFDRVKERAYENVSFSLESLMHDLEFYADPEYGELRMSYSLPHLTEEGVQLMTAHQSKGLEFHTVILANFRDGHWDKRRRPATVSVPEDLLFGWEKEQKAFEQHQDERRVAYVAMTRAKKELIFTCPEQLTTGDKAKSVSPSAFFAEAETASEEARNLKDPAQASTLLLRPVRKIDSELAAFLKQRLETFRLSATALNHFLEDPQMFLEYDLLQKPQAKNIHFAYGNAIHHVLASWAQGVQSGKILGKEEMLQKFTNHLRTKELLTDGELKRLEKIGMDTLPSYYDEHLQAPYPVIHKVEFDISAHLDDIPMKGKIDRIDLFEPNSTFATIIDYKTGSPKSDAEIEKYGYFRQLVFYALLIEHSSLLLDPQEFILHFVGEGEDGSSLKKFSITENDRKALTEVIKAVWQKILALDFTAL